MLAEFVRLCHEKHGAPSAGVSAEDVIEVVVDDKEELVDKDMLEESTEKKLGSISGSDLSRDTMDESASDYVSGTVSPRRTSETKPSTAATFTVASHSRVLSKVALELNEIVADENDERSQVSQVNIFPVGCSLMLVAGRAPGEHRVVVARGRVQLEPREGRSIDRPASGGAAEADLAALLAGAAQQPLQPHPHVRRLQQ